MRLEQKGDWLELQADFAKELEKPAPKPTKDGDKLARKYAEALDKLLNKEKEMMRAQNAWAKARAKAKYLEKELDKLSAI